MKEKIAFFDTKPYDRIWFDRCNHNYEIVYFESKLGADTASLARGCKVVCAFVNDDIDRETIDLLHQAGVVLLAMRCAGYSNVDFVAAYDKIHVVRVPAYSPYAVAEHAMALLLTLNRKLHRAYNRTRDFNFNISGLTGMDLHGKTAGVIGTGKIGQIFIQICKGFGMEILAYDLFPQKDSDIPYVDLDTLLRDSDVISLHCPLTEQTKHIIGKEAFAKIKKGAYIINTSRGGLIDTSALLEALNTEAVKGAGLDVYEEEAEYFFEDMSGMIMRDDTLALLVSKPNVLLTSHQAFLTEEALEKIAEVTLMNIDEFFASKELTNEVCYQCQTGKTTEQCRKKSEKKCF